MAGNYTRARPTVKACLPEPGRGCSKATMHGCLHAWRMHRMRCSGDSTIITPPVKDVERKSLPHCKRLCSPTPCRTGASRTDEGVQLELAAPCSGLSPQPGLLAKGGRYQLWCAMELASPIGACHERQCVAPQSSFGLGNPLVKQACLCHAP